jgi:Zn finger protein HypA/HybF involved in hydrogenase expression
MVDDMLAHDARSISRCLVLRYNHGMDPLADHQRVAAFASADSAWWQCSGCGARQQHSRDGARFCDHCGRPRIDVDWARRLRRGALIVFGIAIQAVAGLMIFIVPPGASVLAWIVYISMGFVGFLHMFIGIELTRRDRADAESSRSFAAGAGGATARSMIERDESLADLPHHAMRCPACEHSLIETIDRGRRTCPNCRARFSLRDIGHRRDDPAGELVCCSPHEARLSGGAMIAILLGCAIFTALVLTTLLAIGSGAGGPGAPGP